MPDRPAVTGATRGTTRLAPERSAGTYAGRAHPPGPPPPPLALSEPGRPTRACAGPSVTGWSCGPEHAAGSPTRGARRPLGQVGDDGPERGDDRPGRAVRQHDPRALHGRGTESRV